MQAKRSGIWAGGGSCAGPSPRSRNMTIDGAMKTSGSRRGDAGLTDSYMVDGTLFGRQENYP